VSTTIGSSVRNLRRVGSARTYLSDAIDLESIGGRSLRQTTISLNAGSNGGQEMMRTIRVGKTDFIMISAQNAPIALAG
jgi:hypothetical protein